MMFRAWFDSRASPVDGPLLSSTCKQEVNELKSDEKKNKTELK